jgi:hypothetical protein
MAGRAVLGTWRSTAATLAAGPVWYRPRCERQGPREPDGAAKPRHATG